MEWDDLKHVLALARSGSVTDAARTLKISAATVSRRVAALERKLGVRLFDRKSNGYTLTDSGQAIRRKAEEVEEAVLSVEREVLGRDQRAAGKVRVTMGDDIAAIAIAPRLADFERRFPKIALEIVARFELSNLVRREADIALRTVRPAEGDFVVRHVGWWNLGLYAAKSYARAHQLRPGGGDLAGAGVITWTEDYAHIGGGPWFAEHARGSPVVLRANSRLIQQAACKAGIGVAILPCLSADREADLVCLLPPERVVSTKLWLVVHRDLVRAARIRAVMDFLAACSPRRSRR